jgi:1-acyl-sn-glycerol-3-phosphate acyltransferase
MAKEELFRLPVSGWFLRMLGAFPVKRGAPDLKAFKTALSVLDRGEVLGLFPEGTRSKDRRIHKAELGAAAIALKTGAPVVPVAVASSYHIKDTVTVAIGKPLAFGSGEKRHDPYSGGKEKPGTVLDNFGSGNHMGGPCDKDDGKGGKNERYRQVSNEIMEAIGRLLDGSQDTVESE